MPRLYSPVTSTEVISLSWVFAEGVRLAGGQPRFIEPLARAAAATGIDALFIEVHNALLPIRDTVGLGNANSNKRREKRVSWIPVRAGP